MFVFNPTNISIAESVLNVFTCAVDIYNHYILKTLLAKDKLFPIALYSQSDEFHISLKIRQVLNRVLP